MLDAINNILNENKLAEVKQASLTVDISEQQNQQQIQSRIGEFNGIGWLSLTDKVLTIRDKADLSGIQGKTILVGELTAGSKSLHIRQNGAAWDVFELTRTDSGGQFMVEESFLSTQSGLKLTYETYWQKDSSGALSPFAGRFTGFSNQGGSN